ncbi:MAG TPA: ATP-binding protein, partial [Dokdonella sp.]|nr:ATP-binding protein [Dokdonella sp.]
LPDRERRHGLLFYEATEGGAGVLTRLVHEPDAFARVAWEALRLLHLRLDETPPERSREGWLAEAVYRWLLAPPAISDDAAVADIGAEVRFDDDALRPVLAGTPGTRWRSAADGTVRLIAAVPLADARGALVLEQANPAVPALTNRALLSLLGASLTAFAVTAIVLLAFGGLLSWRIARLRNATERATGAGGRLDGALPLVDAKDELGDLARSFAALLDEIGHYTDYLRTLAAKLSHELNTPLAIVKSSLDNLDHQDLPAAAHAYLERARDGVARLGGIVRAMSEAHRIERAIAAADAEDFDLHALVVGCTEGYRALVGTRRLVLDADGAALPFHGAPELLAQALDKLFDNARSFTPEYGTIEIRLAARDGGVRLAIANDGPLLPATMQDRLFDTLVSVREPATRGSEPPHLGLGLTVVRLVAELHQGRAQARNREDDSGVEFILDLRGMPRRRL